MKSRGFSVGDKREDGYIFCGIRKTGETETEIWRHPNYKERERELRKLRAQKTADYQRAYAAKNFAILAMKRREYRKRVWDKIKEDRRRRTRKWQIENPHLVRANLAKRRAAKKALTAEDSNSVIINAMYEMAARVQNCTGIGFDVDHIVPLSRGGFHHQSNLQILPRKINQRKYNHIL